MCNFVEGFDVIVEEFSELKLKEGPQRLARVDSLDGIKSFVVVLFIASCYKTYSSHCCGQLTGTVRPSEHILKNFAWVCRAGSMLGLGMSCH